MTTTNSRVYFNLNPSGPDQIFLPGNQTMTHFQMDSEKQVYVTVASSPHQPGFKLLTEEDGRYILKSKEYRI